MRIVFVVDIRSPIARNWIEYFIEREHEVHIISSYPCSPDLMPKASINQFPVAFSQFSRITHNGTTEVANRQSLLTRGLASLRTGALSSLSTSVRFWLAPLELQRHVEKMRDLIKKIAPDIVHAMRIPFEGILAAKATPAEIPLLISVWGNDFTLFARRKLLIADQTIETLKRANALHCDCRRDFYQATREWGFDAGKPSRILPGAGGIKPSLFHSREPDISLQTGLNISRDMPVIINPRGFRSYVRNDIFFQAIPQRARFVSKSRLHLQRDAGESSRRKVGQTDADSRKRAIAAPRAARTDGGLVSSGACSRIPKPARRDTEHSA